MKIGTAVLTLMTVALPAIAADYSFDLKPNNTKIAWTLADPLHTVTGSFKVKGGAIDLNPETGKASGQITVDVASGESGNGSRDKDMHNKVLQSAKYPEAIFVPASIEGTFAPQGPSKFRIRGAFTIHGAAHDVAMDVQSTGSGDQIHATITFEIPYVAWGMKDPSNFLLKVGKTVGMSIDVSGTLRKKP
jgi:polyisoprenoid-binding protein YceI